MPEEPKIKMYEAQKVVTYRAIVDDLSSAYAFIFQNTTEMKEPAISAQAVWHRAEFETEVTTRYRVEVTEAVDLTE